MFVQQVGSDRVKAKRRFAAAGIDLQDGAPEDWGVETDGISADTFTRVGRILRTKLQVGVRKNCLAVSVNPKIGEVLGYQPAAPQYLYPGYLGQIDVYVKSQDDSDLIEDLPWLVRLHLVPVTKFI